MIQGVASYFTLLSTASTICLLVGLCSLLIAFVEDLANDLCVLSITNIPNKHHEKLLEDFCNTMQHYSQVKQLSAGLLLVLHLNNRKYVVFVDVFLG